MACDVFEKDPFGADFADDPGNVGPEVALVGVSFSLPGMAERLAGISRKHGVESASEGLAVESGEIIPDRGGGEVSGPLGGDDG